MATQTFDYFLPEVALDVLDCPQPLIIHALRSAAIDLCSRSLAWVYQIPQFDTVANQAEYALTLPDGVDLVMPVRVFLDGVPIDNPLSLDSDLDVGAPVASMTSGTPVKYAINENDQFVLLPPPATDGIEVVVRAAVCPSRDSTAMDAVIASNFYVEIASGAIAQLCASENRPYSNAKTAVRRAAMFDAGVAAAANRKLKGATTKSLSIRPRCFA
jgi:hypothetical protein